MRIAFFEMLDWQKEYISSKLPGHELLFFAKDEQNVPADIEVASNFVAFPISRVFLEKYPQLKLVATRSTGFDHIDLKACAEKNITVCNVPTYGENTVAEFTFALILALSRKIYPAIKRVREQGWFSTEGMEGFDLRGKTIGIIGTGHIGEHVVRMAKGFEMDVLAYDPHPKTELAASLGFSYVSLEDLLKQSDIISLHVPYLPATHHLINNQNISLCKKGCYIINTSRGGLIETGALIGALKSGQVVGAGLDVLEEEGFIKEELQILHEGHPNEQQLKIALADHELMQMDNVIITPHNAFNSKEALIRILDTTIENITAFANGNPVNVVKAS